MSELYIRMQPAGGAHEKARGESSHGKYGRWTRENQANVCTFTKLSVGQLLQIPGDAREYAERTHGACADTGQHCTDFSWT